MRRALFSAAILSVFAAAGCGSSSSVETAERPQVAANGVAADGPASAVQKFLDAVRGGHDDQAAEMLTPVARQETSKHNMVVAPPGSDTASFKVGEVEMIGDDGAHVASFWTDVDEDGEKRTDTIVWMVRKEAMGWRIAGMATRVFDDQPAVILNFEEPEDMLAKQQEIEAEMNRRMSSESDEHTEAAKKPSESIAR